MLPQSKTPQGAGLAPRKEMMVSGWGEILLRSPVVRDQRM